MEGIMQRIYTVIIIGCISFTGFNAYAQSTSDIGSMFQSQTSSMSMDEIMARLVDTSTPTGQVIPTIDVPLVVSVDVPEVNMSTAPAFTGGSLTGRYSPRLKINFTEFPLRSLALTNRAHTGTQAETVAQRIQSRLGVPEIHLVVQNRTATVSGTVMTERQRSLAESMLRFEPGIDTVRNEITVTP